MVRANEEIRKAARAAGVPLWMLGKQIGVCEQTIVRWLRDPLPEEKRQTLMEAIAKLEREVG